MFFFFFLDILLHSQDRHTAGAYVGSFLFLSSGLLDSFRAAWEELLGDSVPALCYLFCPTGMAIPC